VGSGVGDGILNHATTLFSSVDGSNGPGEAEGAGCAATGAAEADTSLPPGDGLGAGLITAAIQVAGFHHET
jgi:hypothetical protein